MPCIPGVNYVRITFQDQSLNEQFISRVPWLGTISVLLFAQPQFGTAVMQRPRDFIHTPSILQASACAVWIPTYKIASRVHLFLGVAMSWDSVFVQTCGSDDLWVHPGTSSRTSLHKYSSYTHCPDFSYVTLGLPSQPWFPQFWPYILLVVWFPYALGWPKVQFTGLAWDCVFQ